MDAKRRNKKFELSFNSFLSIIKKKCFYCGSSPQLKIYSERKTKESFVNGIDRSDSSIGYIETNVVSCCKVCNYAKRTMSVDQFRSWFQRVFDWRKKNEW